MGMRRVAWVLYGFVVGCGDPPPQAQMDEAKTVALEVATSAERDCPWPARLDKFEETVPAGADRTLPPPHAGLFDDMPRGCAVLTFAVDDAGVPHDVQVFNENPVGFGRIATRMLRGYDYATGANSLTTFAVRIGARVLPSGAALMQMTFKDRIINVIVPR